MPHLGRKSASPRHLLRKSTGHLAFKPHPGYTASESSVSYYGSSENYESVEYNDEFYNRIMGFEVVRLTAAIPAMSIGSGPFGNYGSIIGAGYEWGGGTYYNIKGMCKSLGKVTTVTPNSGAPFGNPLCDLVVTVTSSITGASGLGIVTIGTSDTAPTGNPLGWSGTTISSSQTLADFQFKRYIWLGCWHSNPTSVTNVNVDRQCSASLSLNNIRYQA